MEALQDLALWQAPKSLGSTLQGLSYTTARLKNPFKHQQQAYCEASNHMAISYLLNGPGWAPHLSSGGLVGGHLGNL